MSAQKRKLSPWTLIPWNLTILKTTIKLNWNSQWIAALIKKGFCKRMAHKLKTS